MKPQPKRTTTQPGLGQVKAPGDGRRTTRERMGDEGEPVESARVSRPITAPPGQAISAPPPSGGGRDGSSPRHTRAIESSRPANQRRSKEVEAVEVAAVESKPPPRVDTKPPSSEPIDRNEREERSSYDGRSERGDFARPRTPIDVIQVDPKRLERAAAAKPMERPRGSVDRRTIDADADTDRRIDGARFADEKTTGTRRTIIEGKSSSAGGSRTVDGRPVTSGPGGRAPSMRPGGAGASSPPAGSVSGGRLSGRPSGRPPSGRPNRSTSSKPPRRRGASLAPPPMASAASSPPIDPSRATARSRRVSIREDDVGSAVKNAPDAVGLAGRAVPKLLRTKAEIAEAPIDHRAGFLLAHIDGKTTVQALVDIAGMPEEDVHEILERLRRLGIVAVR